MKETVREKIFRIASGNFRASSVLGQLWKRNRVDLIDKFERTNLPSSCLWVIHKVFNNQDIDLTEQYFELQSEDRIVKDLERFGYVQKHKIQYSSERV